MRLKSPGTGRSYSFFKEKEQRKNGLTPTAKISSRLDYDCAKRDWTAGCQSSHQHRTFSVVTGFCAFFGSEAFAVRRLVAFPARRALVARGARPAKRGCRTFSALRAGGAQC